VVGGFALDGFVWVGECTSGGRLEALLSITGERFALMWSHDGESVQALNGRLRFHSLSGMGFADHLPREVCADFEAARECLLISFR